MPFVRRKACAASSYMDMTPKNMVWKRASDLYRSLREKAKAKEDLRNLVVKEMQSFKDWKKTPVAGSGPAGPLSTSQSYGNRSTTSSYV